LVQEINSEERPVYFVSRALHGADIRYQTIEKVAMALIITTRRMRMYFQNHRNIVQTNYPIMKILAKLDLAGRMISWTIELSEFHIQYQPRGAIKSQALANFAVELTPFLTKDDHPSWILHVDGSSNERSCDAEVVLEGPGEIVIEQALKFDFRTSNNQAEYEALIAGLHLAQELEITRLICKSDSRLVIGQLNDEYEVRESLLQQYYHFVKQLMNTFSEISLQHVRRDHNTRADALSRLATTKNKGIHQSVIYVTLARPSIDLQECLMIDSESTWITPIKEYLLNGTCSPRSDKTMKQKTARFILIGDDLYRRGYTRPLLQCLTPDQASYVVRELHEGICGTHSGACTMAAKVFRAGYYWPTVQGDCTDFVCKCLKCQEFGTLSHQKPKELHYMFSPWPFVQWGMDIIGPCAPSKGQCKFLLVGIDYFTKWIEAEPLTVITARNVQNFVWKNIVCRFGLPQIIITDNGRQFTDRTLAEFYAKLHIKHIASSVEHPQTNGWAEAANKAILNELKKRLGPTKGNWTEELLEVLWAYRCTPQTTTQETPYSLTYGTEAMIPSKLENPISAAEPLIFI